MDTTRYDSSRQGDVADPDQAPTQMVDTGLARAPNGLPLAKDRLVAIEERLDDVIQSVPSPSSSKATAEARSLLRAFITTTRAEFATLPALPPAVVREVWRQRAAEYAPQIKFQCLYRLRPEVNIREHERLRNVVRNIHTLFLWDEE